MGVSARLICQGPKILLRIALLTIATLSADAALAHGGCTCINHGKLGCFLSGAGGVVMGKLGRCRSPARTLVPVGGVSGSWGG